MSKKFLDSTSPKARYADLMRQGFMKPAKARKPKTEHPIVACTRCMDWHREGRHIKRSAE